MNKGLLVLIVQTSHLIVSSDCFGSSCSTVLVSPQQEPDLPPGYVGI